MMNFVKVHISEVILNVIRGWKRRRLEKESFKFFRVTFAYPAKVQVCYPGMTFTIFKIPGNSTTDLVGYVDRITYASVSGYIVSFRRFVASSVS